MSENDSAINARRTFAIISHPDAGKTTITEKLLLLGSAINVAGSVKGKRARTRHLTGWQWNRSAVFQSRPRSCNFLITIVWLTSWIPPAMKTFEDTYRTLTAVDSALMVVDGAKGVEDRTIKLMNVCRLRDTPIIGL